jgi:DNA mismatch repair protein MutS2
MRTPGVQNASCEFDIETLQPTYRLITGIPGKSSAFAISQRLGFPPRLIQRASELIGEKDRKVEDVLSRLEKNRRELEEQTALAQQLDQDARQAREEALQERERVRQESDKELDRARIQARRIVEQAKLLYNRLSDEMEQIKKSYLDAQTARDLSERRRAAKRLLGEMEDAADPIARRCNDSYSLPRELRIGDSVLLHQYNTVGTVVSLPDKSGKVGIQAGTMNITVDEKELRLEPEKSRKGPVRSESFSAAELRMQTLEAKTDLDIRGQNAEEGLLELDAFLDNAALGGIPTVMVIHGKGTGVLRKAVQNHLKNHPLVKSYRNGKYGEGEMGVTVVEMK